MAPGRPSWTSLTGGWGACDTWGGHLLRLVVVALAIPGVSERTFRARAQSLQRAMAVGHLLTLAVLAGASTPKFLKAVCAGVFPGVAWDGLLRSEASDLPEPV